MDNLSATLTARGHHFQFTELESALKVFQDAGCGDYQRGRPLPNSRLVWELSAREIAQGVLDQAQADRRDEAAPTNELANGFKEGNATPPVPMSNVSLETHHFPVRRGVVMEFQIRADMTAAELINLSDFVRIIAASRSSEEGEK